MISVASWNVLHRVHAENWYEAVALRWPDEAARNAAVAERVAGLGPGFAVAELPPELPTRPRRGSARKSQFIDHIVTRGTLTTTRARAAVPGRAAPRASGSSSR
ncbi:hypothetical protein [Nocardia harenae]|uniref:hypothetical protein n=1 Tax=Nocardia harenae TaxID=358707 RepID=UPI00082B65E4|nr:hypothetical protein [Nocardia harenae]